MRTPEVEAAISNTRAGMYCTVDADTLADEVERLEAHVAELKALREQDRSERIAIMEVANIAAEAAEARVAELEERLKGTLQAGGYQYFYEQLHAAEREAGNARYVAEQAQAKVAELEAQNARLREGAR